MIIGMEVNAKRQERRARMSSIRQSLSHLPLLKKATLHLELKLEKTRSRRLSQALTDKDVDLSLPDSTELDSQEMFPSLFNDQFEVAEKIGEGAHGIVRKCFCRETGAVRAVKTFKTEGEQVAFLKKNFVDVKKLQHRHVIGYQALFFEMQTDTCHLVMDYFPFPDLLAHPNYSERQLKQTLYQVLQALRYIHQQNICHRDIKPENILYDAVSHRAVLIDFGISKKLVDRGRKRDMLTLTGTPYYRAPEMFEGGGYDHMVDLWALGITMFRLMTGYTPFESEYISETIANIIRGEVVFPAEAKQKYSKSARNLVVRLLKKKAERLTAEEALKDMWFIDFHRNEDEHQESKRSASVCTTVSSELCLDGFHASYVGRVKGQPKKAPDEVELKEGIKKIKSMKSVSFDEDNMIYGCESVCKPHRSLLTPQNSYLSPINP